MTKEGFFVLVKFPKEWKLWDMYPESLAEIQVAGYEPGHEDASEHDRCGAFHWWLKNDPSEEKLVKLMRLAYLDPDRSMGADIRHYICKAKNYSDLVSRAGAGSSES